jgi:hypothetical protein
MGNFNGISTGFAVHALEFILNPYHKTLNYDHENEL